MIDMKNINVSEFQKCGEIMFSNKKNKIIMSCNFCQEMFKQLQGFMRHLQIQHNDRIEFVKQIKEVEIYAVEELINQTVASCTPDMESDESNMSTDEADWLNEEELKWLAEGTEPKGWPHDKEEGDITCREERITVTSKEEDMLNVTNKENEDLNVTKNEKDDLNVTNISILRALEECDVSFNFMDKFNSTRCTAEEQVSNLDSILLQQKQNNWAENDTNRSKPEKGGGTDNDTLNNSKILQEICKELEADTTITEFDVNNSFVKEDTNKPEENIQQSPARSIKNLLQGLEDLDDVDSLLDDLENDTNTNEDDKLQENKHVTKDNFKEEIFKEKCKKDLSINGINKSKILTYANLVEKLPNSCQNESENRQVLDTIISQTETDDLNKFEARLQELENALNEDILESSNMSTKNTICKQINKTSKVADKKTDFQQTLKDLEDALITDNNDDEIISDNNNKTFYNDLEKEHTNLEETEFVKENKSTVLKDKTLNEDLTKALADALDGEDLDLITIQLEEESEEPLNENLLDLLERELGEKEIEKKLPEEKQHKSETNSVSREEESEEPLNEDILNFLERELVDKEVEKEIPMQKPQKHMSDKKPNSNNVLKEEKFINALETELKNKENKKYQKTNLKAGNKTHETLPKNKSNHRTNMILKETNSIISDQIKREKQKSQQQLSNIINSLKSPSKPYERQIMSTKIRESKTPNKVNLENINFNMQEIKKEYFTPSTGFINTERGNKTPIKREEMFFKQSPQTQEKHETVRPNMTPKSVEKTIKIQNFEQTAKSEEKQENSHLQKTPKIVCQKSPHFKNNQEMKQTLVAQETRNVSLQSNKILVTPPNDNFLVSKIENNKSPLNSSITRPNKNLSTPSKTVTDKCHLNDGLINPFTTPSSRKLKNVAVKLQRCTPDKLENNFKHRLTKSMENSSEQMAERFNISKDIPITAVGRQQVKTEDSHCEIIETPIKTSTYSQQNFTESSLKKIQEEEEKEQDDVKKQVSLIKSECNVAQTLQRRTNTPRIRQRMASIDIVTTSEETVKQEKAPNINKTPRHSNLDYKSYAVIRSTRKKEVLKRMRNIKKQIFKSIESSDSLAKFKNKQSSLIKQKRKQNVVIENVKILPNLEKEALTPFLFNNFKTPFKNNSTTPTTSTVSSTKDSVDIDSENSLNTEAEKYTKTSLKRQATSPLLEDNELVKRQNMSSTNNQNEEKTSSDLEKTQLDLSESCVDFLQRDLRANRLNVESFLNSDMPEVEGSIPDETNAQSNGKDTEVKEAAKDAEVIINDILEQVVSETPAEEEKAQKQIAANKPEPSINSTFVEDFEDSKDIDLLGKFGLKVIKLLEIEDVIFLEERDEMHKKARKFADIYINWQRIWSTKNCESRTFKAELDNSFKGLLHELNLRFHVKLNLVEVKRLVNLISFWIAQNVCSKLIEKRKISDSTNRYLSYFFFIPKTIKRFFYCEYCEEYFTTEHKYFTHRMIHTGALYPYICQKCFVGYKLAKQFKNHESLCIGENFKEQLKKNACAKVISKSYKCSVCAELFETSQLLYEHSKKHLKNVYRCAKCSSIFASAIDVEVHMKVCNTVTRRMLKPDTPRQPKMKQNNLKN